MAVLAFIALGFIACDSDSVGGIKKPLVYKNFDNQLKPYYVIQSQDENTIIEDYVVNRGNCNAYLLKYKFDKEKTENKEIIGELCAKYKDKDKEFCTTYYSGGRAINYLLDKQGNKIKIGNDGYYGDYWWRIPREIYANNIDFYNNLHDDFKKFYEKVEHKLGFGDSMAVKTKCSADRIMEIELTLNGGKKVAYKFDPQYGGF